MAPLNNKHWLICSARSSRALTQTHRVTFSCARPPPNTTTLLRWNSSIPGSERLPHRCIVSHAVLLPTRPRCCHDCVSGVSQPKHRRHSDAALHQLQIHPTAAGRPAARPSRVASALTVDGSNFLYCLTDRGCMKLKRSWRCISLISLTVLPWGCKLSINRSLIDLMNRLIND